MSDQLASVRRGYDFARSSDAAGHPTTEAWTVIRDADTGARPLLVACTDGYQYWVKGPDNPHGNLTLVHEWVISELSRVLGGPLPVGALIDVDAELLLDWRIDGSHRVAGTWFGSRLVEGDEVTRVERAQRDGNPQRIPYYLALWHLCLGPDPQFIYDRSQDDQLWSIDHGLWFYNGEGDWNESGGLTPMVHQRWNDPEWQGTRLLDPGACHQAADRVEALSGEILGEIMGGVPVDWGIPSADLEELALFILTRRGGVSATLRARANRS